MPKLNRPATLQDLAIRRLATYFCDHCIIHDGIKTWCDFSSDIEALKNYLVSTVPMEFYRRFEIAVLERIKYPSGTHKPTVVRVKMLSAIAGFESNFISHLDHCDAEKITELSILRPQWRNKWVMSRNLDSRDLKHLTIFEMRESCSDACIKTIAQNCPELRIIDVSHSDNVTDVGLRALGSLSNLRRAKYTLCSVTLQGIEDLISINDNIEGMSAWTDIAGCDLWSPSIHPGIQSLTLTDHELGEESRTDRLRRVVRKFSNLITLIIEIDNNLSEDLSVLTGLGKLSHLEIDLRSSPNLSEFWQHLATLLGSIGADIEVLSVPVSQQSQLDLIYERCKNIKYLDLSIRKLEHHEPGLQVINRLVVPPFSNLTVLRCAG